MQEPVDCDSSSADRLRLEILVNLQIALHDTGRHLLNTDDALDCSVSSDKDDSGDLGQPFTHYPQRRWAADQGGHQSKVQVWNQTRWLSAIWSYSWTARWC